MIQRWLPLAGAFLFAWSLGAQAQQSCLMEGSMQMGSQTLQLKDCMTNRGMSEEDFKQTCRNVVQSNASMGAKGKVTLLEACPAKPQAVCKGLGGKPLDAYYYERNAEDIKTGEDGCKKLGGTWQVGTVK